MAVAMHSFHMTSLFAVCCFIKELAARCRDKLSQLFSPYDPTPRPHPTPADDSLNQMLKTVKQLATLLCIHLVRQFLLLPCHSARRGVPARIPFPTAAVDGSPRVGRRHAPGAQVW